MFFKCAGVTLLIVACFVCLHNDTDVVDRVSSRKRKASFISKTKALQEGWLSPTERASAG